MAGMTVTKPKSKPCPMPAAPAPKGNPFAKKAKPAKPPKVQKVKPNFGF